MKRQIKPTPARDFANEALDNGERKLDCYQSVCFIISILFATMNHDLNSPEWISFSQAHYTQSCLICGPYLNYQQVPMQHPDH